MQTFPVSHPRSTRLHRILRRSPPARAAHDRKSKPKHPLRDQVKIRTGSDFILGRGRQACKKRAQVPSVSPDMKDALASSGELSRALPTANPIAVELSWNAANGSSSSEASLRSRDPPESSSLAHQSSFVSAVIPGSISLPPPVL